MEPQIKTLVDSLCAKTKDNKARWERTGSGDQFLLNLENGKLFIDKLVLKIGGLAYKIAITNANGEVIYNLSAKKLDSPPSSVTFVGDYQILKDLHDTVKRSYFKVDETINGLIKEIEKPGDIGKETDPLP